MLLDARGYVKICDYGLAKFLPLGQRTATFLGTLAYIPPEAIAGLPYGHDTDLWGLAVACYEMLFGSSPFEPNALLSDREWRETTKRNILGGALRFPTSTARAPLPARLFLKSMLELRPEDRLHAPDLAYHKARRSS
jgi:serine/threonine protein kinase